MKPSSPNRVRSYTRLSLSLITLLMLVGVALWYFQPHATPRTAPLGQNKTPAAPAPVAKTEPVSAGQGSAPGAALVPIPTSVKASSSSLAAKPQVASLAAQQPQSGVGQPITTPVASLTPDPKPQTPNEELAATARMYAAHASLRTPEVADPDSKTNKQILQTMVLKALAQHATPPPALSNQVTSAK